MSIQAALALAETYGLPVLPCRLNDEIIDGKEYKAKSPFSANGFKDASLECDQIEQWWHDHPSALVGVPTGHRTALLAIDIDPEGAVWYSENAQKLACGRVHRTKRGHHLLYRMPKQDIRNSVSKVAPGVDVRAEGGYIIWWPAHGLEAVGGLEDITDPPPWLLAAIAQPDARSNVVSIGKIPAGRRNDYLFREACKLRHIGWSQAEIEDGLASLNARCQEPLTASELAQIAGSAARYEIPENDAAPKSRYIDWGTLEGLAPPDRLWFNQGWLHSGVTLLAGRGGTGKSLIGQQLASALALGRPFFAPCSKPVRTLTWACEDEHDEIWRRQAMIAKDHGVPIGGYKQMAVDERLGLENTLFAVVQGHTVWTALLEYLREQVNDLKTDVLFLDNVSHTYGGNENDRHHVTTFINGLVGLVLDRPFAVVLYGHLAKALNSEYSGSTAWENAVRMRWYLGKTLPDQTEEQTEETPEAIASRFRYLCKRKTNYSETDYVRFEWEEGLYRCKSIIETTGVERQAARKHEAEAVVLETVRLCQLQSMQVSASRNTENSIAKVAKTLGTANGISGPELFEAATRLRALGTIVEDRVGSYKNRTPKFGLVFPKVQ